jgi:hypothetical protein
MRMQHALVLFCFPLVDGWRIPPPRFDAAHAFAVLLSGAAIAMGTPPVCADTGLGYIDNAGSASYSQVQRAWEKSATMTEREKVLALRGASKPADPASESPKSKKRRAMAGCKDDIFRASSGYKDEASCNARVLGGDVAFMLDIMDAE